MKRAVFLVIVFLVFGSGTTTGQVADSLREQMKIRETLLTGQVEDLVDVRERQREVWARIELQTTNLLRAQREGETVDSLRLRDEDLRRAEAELLDTVFKSQQLRRSILENRTMLAAIDEEVQRISSEVGVAEAPLTGTWRLVVDPGQDGTAYLRQQGTLVTGTYSLAGGFTGSFRGTLVAGKVRLERIDSQIGFAAIFYARLVGQGRSARLQGNWEATQLASGLPSAGTWTARRIDEVTE